MNSREKGNMARPLPTPGSDRSGTNGTFAAGHAEPAEPALGVAAGADLGADDRHELEYLKAENSQLRELCAELEQALQESAHQADKAAEERAQEYEALLEEKSEMIRQLHQQLHEAQAGAKEAAPPAPVRREGPIPREEELLALSEELERERRQLQEDEQALMEQMRQMEVGMARERAELARQRNDLQRLRAEIAHELERLERSGALQSKMEALKGKLQDVSTRRGAAPSSPGVAPAPTPPPTPPPPTVPSKKEGLIGRLFGQGG
jgi:hypothetical protein